MAVAVGGGTLGAVPPLSSQLGQCAAQLCTHGAKVLSRHAPAVLCTPACNASSLKGSHPSSFSLVAQVVTKSAHSSQCSSRRSSKRNSPATSQPSTPGAGPPSGAAFAAGAPAARPRAGAGVGMLRRLRALCALVLPSGRRHQQPLLTYAAHPPALPGDGWHRLRVRVGAAVASDIFLWQGITVTLFNCGLMAAKSPGNSHTLGEGTSAWRAACCGAAVLRCSLAARNGRCNRMPCPLHGRNGARGPPAWLAAPLCDAARPSAAQLRGLAGWTCCAWASISQSWQPT